VSVETPAFAGMVRRVIRAHGRRCALSDPIDLRELDELHHAVDAAMRDAVKGLREIGFSWSEIAEGLGVNKQAAWERFH
jgi:hypothetical protein